MGADMQIQGDRYVATAQAAQPPRLGAENATPENARAFTDWMASQGYDPARLEGMSPLELERMYTAGPDTWDADEAQAQALLVVLGYAPGPIDGWYGPRTSEAVAQFQGDHGIEPADGAMTPETLEAMQAAAAGESAGTGVDEPIPGTAGYTDHAIGQAITAVDSARPASPNASDHLLEGINAGVDDAVEAEYTVLVEEQGMTSGQAREALANRYGDGTRSDQVMEASLGRLERDGRIGGPSAGESTGEEPAVADPPGNGTLDTGRTDGSGRRQFQNYVGGAPVGEPYYAAVAPNGMPANSTIIDEDGQEVGLDERGEPRNGTHTEPAETADEGVYRNAEVTYVDGKVVGTRFVGDVSLSAN